MVLDGLGGSIVKITAALIIASYLVYLRFFGKWKQSVSNHVMFYSVLTGICVGAALMAVVGIVFLDEPATMVQVSGIVLLFLGLFLLRYSPMK